MEETGPGKKTEKIILNSDKSTTSQSIDLISNLIIFKVYSIILVYLILISYVKLYWI